MIHPVDFFYALTDFVKFLPSGGGYIHRAWRGGIRICANFLLPIYFLATQNNSRHSLKSTSKQCADVIVSLTTFPVRIKKVHVAIESLLRQTVRPKRIILWLSKDQFKSFRLPQRLQKLQARGLEIYFREGDIRSHKKYFYITTELPNENFITADDDIIYDSHFIEDFFIESKKHPNHVLGRLGLEVFMDEHEKIVWNPNIDEAVNTKNLHFGSGAGCFFPRESFFTPMLNKDLISQTCPFADDVWLNVMCRMKNTRMIKIKTRFSTKFLPIIIYGNTTLAEKNCGEQNLNFEQIKSVRNLCILQWNKDPYAH